MHCLKIVRAPIGPSGWWHEAFAAWPPLVAIGFSFPRCVFRGSKDIYSAYIFRYTGLTCSSTFSIYSARILGSLRVAKRRAWVASQRPWHNV